ncbi:hypothetical protein K4L06_11410 [Lysobacter sp. BMK333-48F3]|uniref:hypothetical protein n=1 Tax=Lysobacter sp. BMK333-48F3 TaxID=2867962 RepID=UPI001C8C0BEA|nr:hypothetical protein [Lysobacter sp. BMK333-48F3]MBX9401918.1 hypothetical protein [Lysobacter sp. BMK333-48F3]
MKSTVFGCALLLAALPSLASPAAAPDRPMRKSAWLAEAMDSKTCPIVSIRLVGENPRAADGEDTIATIWRSAEDELADLDRWPTLYLSLAGRPLALRRVPPAGDVESAALSGETLLRWSASRQGVSASLRLRAPRLWVENDGAWTEVAPARMRQAREAMDGASTRSVWVGHLTLVSAAGRWQAPVRVESLCGP